MQTITTSIIALLVTISASIATADSVTRSPYSPPSLGSGDARPGSYASTNTRYVSPGNSTSGRPATVFQKVCITLDKNAHNSIWTKRDNSAKMRIYTLHRYGQGRDQWLTSNPPIELHYGQPQFCQDVKTTNVVHSDNFEFRGKVKIDLQYGGDCVFNATPGKTVYAGIHHRRADIVNPWSCGVY